GIPALGEIPDALLALASHNGHFAARGEELEHEAHLALAPPAVVFPFVAGGVRDLAREEWPALAQLLEDMATVSRARLDPLDDAPVERPIASAHEGLQHRQVLGG